MSGSVFSGKPTGWIIGIGLMIFLILIVPLLYDWKTAALADRGSARAELMALQTRSTHLAQDLGNLSDSQIDSILWQADETGVATAKVQAEVSNLASQSEMSLRAISPKGESELDSVRLLQFRLEAEATLDQLSRFLQAVEYRQPVVFAQTANIRRLNKPNATSDQPIVFVQIEFAAPIAAAKELSQ